MIGTAGAAALVMALVACSAGTDQMAKKQALVPRLIITPADGTAQVRPGARVMVQATNGTVRDVQVQTRGAQVVGRLSDKGTLWRSTGLLIPSRKFTVTATAIGSGGKTVTTTSSFSTLKPKKTFRASTLLAYGGVYGVGMPIILNFSHAITHKAAVERAIHLRTSKRVWVPGTGMAMRRCISGPARTGRSTPR